MIIEFKNYIVCQLGGGSPDINETNFVKELVKLEFSWLLQSHGW